MLTNQGTPERPMLRALLLGQRLETRGLEHQGLIALMPLTLRVSQQGLVFLFRYGVAVFFRVPAVEEEEILRSLRPRIVDPLEVPEIEQATIALQPDTDDHIEPLGGIALKDASADRLQIVANALSKSVVLAHHESQIAATFDRIEPLAVGIKRKGRVDREARQLIQQIGDILLTQHRMVGRVEVEDKPDILWDRPELERLYARLEDEYELLERSRRSIASSASSAKPCGPFSSWCRTNAGCAWNGMSSVLSPWRFFCRRTRSPFRRTDRLC